MLPQTKRRDGPTSLASRELQDLGGETPLDGSPRVHGLHKGREGPWAFNQGVRMEEERR